VTSFDWRQHGAVTSVKNQSQCGGCYSFSAAAAMEGVYAIASGTLITMSPQQILDCSSNYGNEGCNGGLMDYAFSYLKSAKLESWNAYSYSGSQSECKYDPTQGIVGTTGYVDLP